MMQLNELRLNDLQLNTSMNCIQYVDILSCILYIRSPMQQCIKAANTARYNVSILNVDRCNNVLNTARCKDASNIMSILATGAGQRCWQTALADSNGRGPSAD